jgi:hypothetical protein
MLGFVTYFVILAGLVVGAWRRPAIGIAAVLCLYGLKQWGQSSTQFIASHGQFTNYAVAATAVLGLALLAHRRSCVFCQWPPTVKLVIALYAYAFITVAWAPDTMSSLQQWVIQGPYVLTVALLAPLLVTSLEDVGTAFIGTVIAGAVLCALALAFGHWGFRGLVLYGDILESETNPLAMASLAGTVLIIAALSLNRPNPIWLRILAIVAIPVTMAVILRSGSRGQLLAAGVALAVAWPLAFRPRDSKSVAGLALAAAMVIGLGWFAYSHVEIDQARWNGSQSQEDVAGRLHNAAVLLETAASNPLTALFGLGNSSSFQIIGFYCHISGLEVLGEEGLIGAILYAAILYYTVRDLGRISAWLGPTDPRRATLAILAGLFIFEFILSWKQGSLLSSVYVFAYSTMLARIERARVTPSKSAPAPGFSALSELPFPNVLR